MSDAPLKGETRRSEPVRPVFADVFHSEFPVLCRYIHRRLGREIAEDLAAETFLIAFREWDRVSSVKPIRPWLYGVATNLVRRYRRTEERKLRAYARSGVDSISPAVDEEVLSRVAGEDANRSLAKALAALRQRDRDILLLRAWAELADEEIAAAMSLPIGTVKSSLSRSRGRIRQSLEVGGPRQDETGNRND